MGVVWLALLYLATAVALAFGVRWLLSGSTPDGSPSPRVLTAVVLTLLPLVFTWGGFLPGKALAPTNVLTRIAPWLDPVLVERVEEGSTPPNVLLRDPVSQMIPWSRAARDGWLFNPSQGAGAALLANGQSAVLFPTEIAARWLSPLRGTTYRQAARLLLAIWGMFFLVRRRELSETAALVAAVVYGGAGFLQLWRLHPHSLVAAMAPWIVAAALEVVERPGPRSAIGLAVAGALGVFAGHPETLLKVVLFAALVAVSEKSFLPLEKGGSRRDFLKGWYRVGAWAAVSGVVAALLAAPLLLPFVENLRVSAEWQRRSAAPVYRPGTPVEALGRLAPTVVLHAYGDPVDDPQAAVFAGPDNLAELGGGSLGMAALLLAVLGLAGTRRREAVPWLVLGLFLLLVAVRTPGLLELFETLPLFSVSLLTRFNVAWALAGSVLAGYGVETLREGRGRRTLLVAAGVFALLLLAVAAALPSSHGGTGVSLEALVLGASLLALWVFLRRPASSRPPHRVLWPALAVLLLVLPRAVLFAHWVPRVSSLSFYPETRATRFVEAQEQSPGARVAGVDVALLANAASFFSLEDVRANDPMTFLPYERFLEHLGEVQGLGGLRLLDLDQPILDFLGVRWIFDHPTMGHRPGVEPAYLDPGALVYENPDSLPRAWIPREVEVVADPGAGIAAAARIDDFRRRVAVTGRDLPPPGVLPNGAAEVTELAVEPGRVEAVVRAEDVALVATSQPAIPGWRLFRDGEEHEPLLVHGAFLGAAVEAGTSTLVWEYRPRSWMWGWVLFGVGSLGVLGLWIFGPHPPRSPLSQGARGEEKLRKSPLPVGEGI